MKIGEKIKQLRKKKNLSQEQLAAKIDIHPVHLSKLEKGKFQPSIEVFKKMTDVLEISADYLLSEKDEDSEEISIQDESLAERIRMLNDIDGKDKEMIIHMIDSIVTKRKILNLLNNEKVAS